MIALLIQTELDYSLIYRTGLVTSHFPIFSDASAELLLRLHLKALGDLLAAHPATATQVPASGGSLRRPEVPQKRPLRQPVTHWNSCILHDWWVSCCRSCGETRLSEVYTDRKTVIWLKALCASCHKCQVQSVTCSFSVVDWAPTMGWDLS